MPGTVFRLRRGEPMVAREDFRWSGVAGDALFTSETPRAEAKALRFILIWALDLGSDATAWLM